jgi:hypothetical protein
VESATNSAVFHILTWKAGEGTSATAAVAPTLNGVCTATSSCLKSIAFSGTSAATLASPWIDYSSDKAFVGSDNGVVYRISCAFHCPLNTQPSVDWSFTLPVAGTGGSSATPNGPVYSSQTGHLIVGDQLGELWTINANGASPSLFAGPVMIGGGGCTTAKPPGRNVTGTDCAVSGGSFGIPDSVILDGSAGKVFAFSGNDGTTGASAVVAQLNEDLTGLIGLTSVEAARETPQPMSTFIPELLITLISEHRPIRGSFSSAAPGLTIPILSITGLASRRIR